jgi:acyl-CoA reductase-like NAD-dependent aldehyde dehydrogenase
MNELKDNILNKLKRGQTIEEVAAEYSRATNEAIETVSEIITKALNDACDEYEALMAESNAQMLLEEIAALCNEYIDIMYPEEEEVEDIKAENIKTYIDGAVALSTIINNVSKYFKMNPEATSCPNPPVVKKEKEVTFDADKALADFLKSIGE